MLYSPIGVKVNLGRIVMGEGEILRETNIKFLGVYIDENLSFSYHIEHVMSKMSKSLGILNKLRYFLPPSIMRILYDSLFEPYIKYGIEVWGSAPHCYLNMVHVIQKAAVRAIHELPYGAHTAEYFKMSHILCIYDLYKYQILQLFYKVIKCNFDPDLIPSLTRHSQIHSHDNRNSNNLLLPYCHISNSQRCISYLGPKLWNEISLEIRNSDTFAIFKRELKKMLVWY